MKRHLVLGIVAVPIFLVLRVAVTHPARTSRPSDRLHLEPVHSYDWLAWNAAFAAVLLATGLGARKNGMLPTPLAWATIVIGASLLTPLGFFGFILVPVWLIVVGLWLVVRDRSANATPELVGSES